MLVRLPLHPIDTCKAKLQVQRKAPASAAASSTAPAPFSSVISCLRYTARKEGLRGLYAGFPIAFLGSAPATCLYLTSYEMNKRWLHSLPFLQSAQPVANFAAGLLAECFSCVLWVPIDVVKERMQVQSNVPEQRLHYRSTMHAIATIARTEGLRGVYRGYGATLASFGPYSAFYLSIYDQLKDRLAARIAASPSLTPSSLSSSAPAGAALPFTAYLACGAIAGGTAALITNPLDMAKLRLQVQRAGGGLQFGYRNLLHGVREVVREEGVRGLWKGAGARVAFFAPSSALNIAIFDTLKAHLNARMQRSNG